MRRRIVALVVGMTLLVVLAFAVPLGLLIRHHLEDEHLAEARYQAENLAFLISSQAPTGANLAHFIEEASERFVGQAWVELPGGDVVGMPPDGEVTATVDDPDHDDDDDDRGVSPAAVIDHDGGAVTRVSATTADGVAEVFVYLTDDQLHAGELEPLLILVAVSLALIMLSILGAESLSRRLAHPLELTADAAERLSTGDLTARAPEIGPPEVAKVGVALNRLAARVDEVIATEREAVADLSHRLRTPLTALRLDVDALDDRDTADRLGTHVSTVERTLTAIIHAARRPQREGRAPHVDAAQVVRARAAFWSPLAEDQGRAFSIDVPADTEPVRASEQDLAAAIDALMENVIAHTPEGTAVSVSLTATVDVVSVTVSDAGPGISSDAGRRGRSDRGSSGLGLDIARRCAESSGGTMTITTAEPHGASVVLNLGRP